MKRPARHIFLPAAALLLSCGAQPTIVPTRNLERPSDMTFVCLNATGATGQNTGVVSGRPMTACHPPGDKDPTVTDYADRGLGTFALVTNTARGEVAVIDMDAGRLLDLDPLLPGFNMVPVGLLPESLAASPDGCRALTANRGSCDLTLLDPSRLLAAKLRGHRSSTGIGSPTQTIVPRTRSGRLRVAPGEVVFLPQTLPSGVDITEGRMLCDASGARDGDKTVPWRALVTFPACDLLALIDLPSGEITSSLYIRPTGLVPAGADPVCPTECGGLAAAEATADAGAAAMTDVPKTLHIAPMALLPDGSRVYVGGTDAPFIAAVDVMADGLHAPATGGLIPLHEDALGTTRLRLSVDPYTSLGKNADGFLGSRGEFLYAFARDGSVRVLLVGPRGPALPVEQECDVNGETPPTVVRDQDAETGCIPWSDGPGARRRKPFAQGPGIRVPVSSEVDVPPPIPRDIAFARLVVPGEFTVATDPDRTIDGAFGFLLTSSGQVYLTNLAPTLRMGESVPYTHSFRDANFSAVNANGKGAPRLDTEPIQNFTATSVPFATRVTFPSKVQSPRIENPYIATTSMTKDSNPWITFPDPSAVVPQRWTVIWEDILPGSNRSSGTVEPAGGGGPGAGAVIDAGGDFCGTGVLPGDVVTFVGCTVDTDCGPLGTARCYQEAPGAPGMCFSNERVRNDALVRSCLRASNSRRRYEVIRATPTRLDLGLKFDEVPKPSVAPCATDKDCQPDQVHGPALSGSDTLGFECKSLAPDQPMRCVKRCGSKVAAGGVPIPNDRLCRNGHVCEDVGAPSDVGPICVEGPPLQAACAQDRVRYRVQAGRSYLVLGGAQPRVPAVKTIGGLCTLDPARNPNMTNRIPIGPFPKEWARAPRCADVPGNQDVPLATIVTRPPTTESGVGNPCFFVGANGDEGAAGSEATHVKVLFQNQQIRFVMTNLEQYPGDAASIAFDVAGGFIPEIVGSSGDATVTLGNRIVTSPLQTPESPGRPQGEATATYLSFPYLYVVDQGRSSSGSRGQILRLNPRTGTLGIGRFDSQFNRSTFPIQ